MCVVGGGGEGEEGIRDLHSHLTYGIYSLKLMGCESLPNQLRVAPLL